MVSDPALALNLTQRNLKSTLNHIMWAPVNKSDVPTEEDRIMATEALAELQRDFQDTVKQLRLAQLRVDDLRRDITEREAWLAPVRKLSFDTIAIIFNMSAEDDWRAPLDLASVCRVWREAVLATPRAWTFIDLKEEDSSRLLPLFLKRSGHCGLHVGLPKLCDDEDFTTVAQMADRIRCLSIPTLRKQLKGINFPHLKCLRIFNEITAKSLLQLSAAQFPQLHHLEYAYFYKPPSLASVRAVVDFPAVQSMRLAGLGPLVFSHVLPGCGANLRSLDTFIHYKMQFSQLYIISLPRLESLVFFDARTGAIANTPQFVTPALRALKMGSSTDSDTFPLHMDLGMLQHVQTEDKQIPPLSALHGIRVLQVRVPYGRLTELLRTLALAPSTCPHLKIVEFNSYYLRTSDKELIDNISLEINEKYHGNPQFLTVESWPPPLPGYIEHTCGMSMPCAI